MPSNEWEIGRPDDVRYTSPQNKRILEASNQLDLLEYMWELADLWDGELSFSPEILRRMHEITIQGLYGCAGSWRDRPIVVSQHSPPSFSRVPLLVEDMCERLNRMDDWITASAYAIWRINWIHPFNGGNGRISRAAGYLAIHVILNEGQLIGQPNFMELIKDTPANYDQYFQALETTDQNVGKANDPAEPDLSAMETFTGYIYSLQVESAMTQESEEDNENDQ